MRTTIISAFPACGKTTAFEEYKSIKILDSDSSKFSWTIDENGEKVRSPQFPDNYIEHIQKNIGKYEYIFVSTHEEVRKAMYKAGIEFICVYPRREYINVWVGRMYRRGNDKKFIDFQIANWEKFIDELKNQIYTNKKVELEWNQDIISVFIKKLN